MLPRFVAALLSTSVAAAVLGATASSAAAAAAEAPSPGSDWCSVYRTQIQARGWRVECVDFIPGQDDGPAGTTIGGVTDQRTRTVTIRRDLDEATTRHIVGHEGAHREDVDVFSPQAKHYFQQRLGVTQWYDDADYYGSAVETWADNRSRCLGWHNATTPYRQVPCTLIDETLAYAQTHPKTPVGTRAWAYDRVSGQDWLWEWQTGAGWSLVHDVAPRPALH